MQSVSLDVCSKVTNLIGLTPALFLMFRCAYTRRDINKTKSFLSGLAGLKKFNFVLIFFRFSEISIGGFCKPTLQKTTALIFVKYLLVNRFVFNML